MGDEWSRQPKLVKYGLRRLRHADFVDLDQGITDAAGGAGEFEGIAALGKRDDEGVVFRALGKGEGAGSNRGGGEIRGVPILAEDDAARENGVRGVGRRERQLGIGERSGDAGLTKGVAQGVPSAPATMKVMAPPPGPATGWLCRPKRNAKRPWPYATLLSRWLVAVCATDCHAAPSMEAKIMPLSPTAM